MKDPEVQRIAYLANKTNRKYGRVPEVIQKDPEFKQFMQKSKPIVSKGYGKEQDWGSSDADLQRRKTGKLPIKLQSEGKTSLLNQQSTRSKGGGKSGGGGGKFGWIRRMVNRPASPWSLLRTDKNF